MGVDKGWAMRQECLHDAGISLLTTTTTTSPSSPSPSPPPPPPPPAMRKDPRSFRQVLSTLSHPSPLAFYSLKEEEEGRRRQVEDGG